MMCENHTTFQGLLHHTLQKGRLSLAETAAMLPQKCQSVTRFSLLKVKCLCNILSRGVTIPFLMGMGIGSGIGKKPEIQIRIRFHNHNNSNSLRLACSAGHSRTCGKYFLRGSVKCCTPDASML